MLTSAQYNTATLAQLLAIKTRDTISIVSSREFIGLLRWPCQYPINHHFVQSLLTAQTETDIAPDRVRRVLGHVIVQTQKAQTTTG